MSDQKNVFVAIVISIMILVGWNYFIEAPKQEQRQQAQGCRNGGSDHLVSLNPLAMLSRNTDDSGYSCFSLANIAAVASVLPTLL